MANYEKRVQRGIAFLDSNGPEGWRELLDLEELDLSNAQSCVLGQLYAGDLPVEDRGWISGFAHATNEVFEEELSGGGKFKKLRKLGFEADSPKESYAETTEAWKRALKNGD